MWVYHCSLLWSFSCTQWKSCDTLNDEVLESVLINLPQLVVLHIEYCSSVSSTSILRLSKHTPMLRSLAMTLSVRVPTLFSEPTATQAGSPFKYFSANHSCSFAWTYSGNGRRVRGCKSKLYFLRALFTTVASTSICNSSDIRIYHALFIHLGTPWRSFQHSEVPSFSYPSRCCVNYGCLF